MTDPQTPRPVPPEPEPAKTPFRDPQQTVSMSPDPALVPADAGSPQLPGYEVLDEIARGGMGAVYRARDKRLDRDLAVKVLLAKCKAKPDLVQRFLAEAHLLARLQHPGIVPIHELGCDAGGLPFFAMKLVRGRTLAAMLKERMKEEGGKKNKTAAASDSSFRLHPSSFSSSLPRLLTIFEQLCQAVGYAHHEGVIHRDLKPSNVMVGAFGEVQLMDWGLAKQITETETRGSTKPPDTAIVSPDTRDLALSTPKVGSTDVAYRTRVGHAIGTPAYMSPEQARGEVDRLDERSDVFGLGAILCEILTGQPPNESPTTETLPRAEHDGLESSLRRLDACDADAEIVALAKQCLAADPADRPADGSEVAERVAAYVSAVQERLRQAELANSAAAAKLAAERRARRWLVGLVAALLLATAAAGILAFRAEHHRLVAEANEHRALTEEQRAHAAQVHAENKEAAAKAAEADTRAFGDFLTDDVLAAARPKDVQGGLGVDVKMAGALEEAEKRIDERFAGRPVAEAATRHALGVTWRNLGKYSAAERHLRKALALREEHLGAEATDTLDSRNSLAVTLTQNGQVEEAIALHQRNLAAVLNGFGDNSLHKLRFMGNLGSAYKEASRFSEALPLLEEAVAQYRSTLGPDHLETLQNMNSLAGLYKAMGRSSDALGLYEETLQVCRKTLPDDHAETLRVVNNVARAYQDAGRAADALPLLEETLKLRRARLGADHPDTLSSMNNLAGVYMSFRRWPDALPLLEEAVKLRKQILGEDHPNTLDSMNNLAVVYKNTNRFADGVALLQEVVRLRTEKFGADNPSTLISMSNLAQSYWSMRQFDKSVPLFEEILRLQRRKLGDDHQSTLLTMGNLGVNYRDAGRPADALPLFEEAVRRARERSGPPSPDLPFFMENLAGAHETNRQYAQAEPLWSELLDQQRQQPKANPRIIANRLAVLGLNRLRQQKYSEAEAVLRECLDIRMQTQSDHWSTANAKSMVGGALLGQKKYPDAEPLLLTGYEGMAAIKETPPIRLREAAERIAELYHAWNKPEEASKWKEIVDKIVPTSPPVKR